MIEVKGVYKKFDGCNALNGLDLNVADGSIYGLTGVNGSGKTTIIKIITGVYKPDKGSVKIDGADVFDSIEVKKLCAYIPDDLYFFASYSLKGMAAYLRGMYPSWNQARFEAMVKDFELDPKTKLSRFSKGMQKQAAFILAMSCCPKYLILDEPIDGLDPLVRRKVWNYVVNDVAERGMTVLVSSHNLDELEGICDSIGIISKGEMKYEGDLDALREEMKPMSLKEIFWAKMGGEENEK
ncbi:MAG: ABC transporter ATP-binding protein [Firmicutes bacterium]|nr:ABC transporter ATP-binding protein [Bacillota bacterium]